MTQDIARLCAAAGIGTELLMGRNALKNGFDGIGALGRRALIVTGRNSARLCGALDDLTGLMSAAGMTYVVFDGITENPRLSDCRAAAALAASEGCDLVVGIGGGSPLDAAKAIAFLACRSYDDDGLFFADALCGRLPLVLIGTTAGTGSEITAVSVLTQKDGTKRTFKHDKNLPDISVLDPKYTYSAGVNTAISTALDAFMHAAEGYLSVGCSAVAAEAAELALPAVYEYIKLLCGGGYADESDKDEAYYASILAGVTLYICGTQFPHPLGYVLTESYGVPHGRACAVFLPALLKAMEAGDNDKVSDFEALLGGSLEDISAVIAKAALVEVSIPEADIQALRGRFTNLPHYEKTPGGFDVDEALGVYRELFGR